MSSASSYAVALFAGGFESIEMFVGGQWNLYAFHFKLLRTTSVRGDAAVIHPYQTDRPYRNERGREESQYRQRCHASAFRKWLSYCRGSTDIVMLTSRTFLVVI